MPTRRRSLQLIAATAIAGAGAAWGVGRPAINRYYSGPISDHFDGARFYNAGAEKPRPLTDLVKWQFFSERAAWPSTYPGQPAGKPPASVDERHVRITLIGHASFLVQTAGLNILIDPVFSRRASPYSFVGPSRVNAPGIAFDDLPEIHVVLITHNHYDHLDIETLTRLQPRNRPRIVTALGNDTIIKADIPDAVAEAHDWGASVALSHQTRVHLEPTLHWSARGLRDRRHALWTSFIIEAPAGKLYCVGDSGFGNGDTFRNVGRRHPGLAAALLPIGAYEPRWFMASQHMNPAESVEALRLCGAKTAFGHHWGTFQLTNEAIDQPTLDLETARTVANLSAAQFEALRPGEVRTVTA